MGFGTNVTKKQEEGRSGMENVMENGDAARKMKEKCIYVTLFLTKTCRHGILVLIFADGIRIDTQIHRVTNIDRIDRGHAPAKMFRVQISRRVKTFQRRHRANAT